MSELVYGQTIRMSGEFLTKGSLSLTNRIFRLVTRSNHSFHKPSIFKDLLLSRDKGFVKFDSLSDLCRIRLWTMSFVELKGFFNQQRLKREKCRH